jgi:hypothetical protein
MKISFERRIGLKEDVIVKEHVIVTRCDLKEELF